VDVTVTDPLADPDEVTHEYGITLGKLDKSQRYDAIVLAVAHQGTDALALELVRAHRVPVLIDVKGMLARAAIPADTHYWRL
jgi:UDP-N-acetyl-D-galactosamine dehydrogenase